MNIGDPNETGGNMSQDRRAYLIVLGRLVSSLALSTALAYWTWPFMPLFGVVPVILGGRRLLSVGR
jgi:hypothetical protein